MTISDYELLKEYAQAGSQTAFTELVQRHIHLVHAAALRVTRDPAATQDVAQQVFMLLARKAHLLGPSTVLPAFLYRVTRDLARDFLRRERRRRQREATAAELMSDCPENTWKQVAPLLEEAMARLGAADHDAVVLRFFENQSLKEVGAALKLSDQAAHKRLSRALEKLRRFFAGQGVAVSAAGLAAAIGGFAAPAAPAGIASTIAGAALAGAAAAPGLTLLTIMALPKLKLAIAAVAVATGVTIPIVQRQTLNRLRNEATELRAQTRELSSLRAENARLAKIKFEAAEMQRLRDEELELLRLRGEVNLLRQAAAATQNLPKSSAMPAATQDSPGPVRMTPEMLRRYGVGPQAPHKSAQELAALAQRPEAVNSHVGCQANLRALDQAKETWGLENKKKTGDVPTMANLVPDYLNVEPKCPLDNSSYSINPLGTNPSCPNYSATDAELSLHRF